jgi:hypothetical protein
VDIDHLPIEVDYEKNQHYKCNTLKEYSVDKPSQKSVGSLKFSEGLQQVDSPFARKCKEVDQKPKMEEEKKTS